MRLSAVTRLVWLFVLEFVRVCLCVFVCCIVRNFCLYLLVSSGPAGVYFNWYPFLLTYFPGDFFHLGFFTFYFLNFYFLNFYFLNFYFLNFYSLNFYFFIKD